MHHPDRRAAPAPAPTPDGAMVQFALRLPPRLARELLARSDECNLGWQAVVLAALQAELQRASPDD